MEVAKKVEEKPPMVKPQQEKRERSGSQSEYGHGKKKMAMQKTYLEDAYFIQNKTK